MKGMSSKPGKQRKKLFQASYHIRGKILSAHLSSELQSMYKTRSMPVRTGDVVRVLRGDYRGVEGKVLRVNRKKYRIFIEGITRQKSDGTTVLIPIHPSKVEIIRLNLDDKFRKEILERRGLIEVSSKEKAEAAVIESPKNAGGA